MQWKSIRFLISVIALFACMSGAWAHFLVLKPSTAHVTGAGDSNVSLDIRFTHPMENGPLMQMERPRAFGVLARGERRDLLDTLESVEQDDVTRWVSQSAVNRPGDHIFYIEPEPYWEPAEAKWIVHYTKVVVDGMAAQDTWDTLVGFPVEIQPLAVPYGMWTNNVFRGVVLREGEPVPFAEIEVEYLDEDGSVTAPYDALTTQVIRADINGVFSYALPRAGWWGFAALMDGKPQAGPEGEDGGTELGALMWVQAVDMP